MNPRRRRIRRLARKDRKIRAWIAGLMRSEGRALGLLNVSAEWSRVESALVLVMTATPPGCLNEIVGTIRIGEP